MTDMTTPTVANTDVRELAHDLFTTRYDKGRVTIDQTDQVLDAIRVDGDLALEDRQTAFQYATHLASRKVLSPEDAARVSSISKTRSHLSGRKVVAILLAADELGYWQS